MSRSILVVQTNAVPGREEEFDAWYTDVHLPELLAIPGFVAAQRFVHAPEGRPRDPAPAYRHLAIYEIDASPEEAAAALAAAVPSLRMSDAMDPARSLIAYVPSSPRLVADS